MPRQTDSAERPSPQPPPPELNPLMNPILGQNMGRWAEVYFNSPPEKRDQAVLELLLDLEDENSQSEHPGTSRTPDRDPIPVLGVIPNSRIEEASLDVVGCKLCGRRNPVQHKFCGMCGASLDGEVVASGVHVENVSGAEPVPSTEKPEDDFIRGRPAFDEQMPSSSELEEFLTAVHTSEDTGPDFAPPRIPNSYRAHVGAALALVLLFLVYFAWRGTTSGSPAAQHTSPLLAAPAAATPDPSTRKPESSNRSTSGDANPGASSHTAAKTVTEGKAPADTSPRKSTQTVPLSAGPAEKEVPTQAVSADGSAELAVALSYLRDTNGQQRNPEEAVKWLWKAVSKRNAAATLQLSDLYLRGDGVAKNCDQARVLLDAAASKGTKGAAERLRHLQAFGCQ